MYDEEDMIDMLSLDQIKSIKKNVIHSLKQIKEQYLSSNLKENELYILKFTNQELNLILATKDYEESRIRPEVIAELLKYNLSTQTTLVLYGIIGIIFGIIMYLSLALFYFE